MKQSGQPRATSAHQSREPATHVVQAKARSARTVQITVPVPPILNAFASRVSRIHHWRQASALKYLLSSVAFVLAVLIIFNTFLPWFGNRWSNDTYTLSNAAKAVIAQPDQTMAAVLLHDDKQQVYNFNANYQAEGQTGNQLHAGGAQVQATLHDDLRNGVTVTDPTTQAEFTMTPKIQALAAKRSVNQIQYPIYWGRGSLIYTVGASGVQEDILLKQAISDKMTFSYDLGLGSQYAAKILPDGSVGIYGSSMPLNNVSTSTDKDAALLKKAQANVAKDQLLFKLPAPVIRQNGGGQAGVMAYYTLKQNELKVHVSNLKQANYPLSIDPAVQIYTNAEFVRNTSIESNADFNTSDTNGSNSISRGAITGGTTGTWAATTTMNQARFLSGATAYNDYAYVVGGAGSGTTTNIAGTSTNMVEYAKINQTSGTGSPTLAAWSAGNKTGLPAGGLSRFQLIGYHGFLYAIGGSTTNTTCGTVSSTVYYASVQVNGVLSNWSTTNAPTTARCDFGVAVYGGKIYIAGGKTGAAVGTGTTDVSYADVSPDGTLTWTNAVSPALPAARYGGELQAYNGSLYMVGGSLNGTLTNTVLYASLNSDGSIYAGSWSSTNNFVTARENLGSPFTVIKNGYLYVQGGCSALNANQTCTTAQSDTQLAQINADGSLGQWATTTSLITNGAANATRVGAGEIVWRSTLYNLSGCAAMSTTTISCTTALATTQYGTIQTAGQASVLKTGTNYPLSMFGGAAAVLNGYLYVVGGCTTADCQSGTPSVTNQTYYAKIATDGTLGAWNNVAANTIRGTGTTSGIAETTVVAANGSLYAFGGYNDSAPTRSAFVVTPSPTTGALPGAWTEYTNTLPATTAGASSMYINGYFLVLGGCINTTNGSFGCNSYRQTVTRLTFNGTTWASTALTPTIPTGTNYPNGLMGLAFYYGTIYLCGGAASAQGQTQYCAYNQLDLTGAPTLGTWHLTTGKLNVGTSPDHPIRRNAAFASNGYLYVYSGHDGANNNSVGTINIAKINPTTGDIDSDFNISTTAFTPKWDSASAFADGNIYTVGGCVNGNPPTTCTSGTGPTNKTEYFQIYNATNSGNRASTAGTTYPTTNGCSSGCTGTSTSVSDGYLYSAGGCSAYTVSSATCTTATTGTQFAPINPDGSLGSWSNGPALPAARGFGCMVALNGTLYYIGGANTGGTAQNDVYYSTASGSSWGSGTWAAVNGGSATGKLLAAKGGLNCTTWNNRIYATGGSTSTTTYYSPSLPSGGNITSAWTATTTTFTTNRSYHSAVALGGYLYIIGGYDGTNYLSDVQFAQIGSNGNITATWQYTNDILYKQRQMAAYGANGYIYILGGATSTSNCLNNQYVASVNSDGTLSSWTQGVATSFSAVSGIDGAYHDGYYYVVGGNNCTSNSTAVAIAGEQSQAIRSIFTRYVDLVGDATPQKFVVGGNDALVNTVDIDKWSMTYNSSRIATNAFGAPTLLSPLQFGANPVVINAIDGSSTNQGVSRYWQLSFTIDQTASFSFADVDTTTPAITSYSFYYSPSPSTRLRNGGIFQDQTKQSLDAHP